RPSRRRRRRPRRRRLARIPHLRDGRGSPYAENEGVRFGRIAMLRAVHAPPASSHASSAGLAAPTGLHGFLLRADETASTSFHRTPSFAWNPVAGATRYQFQLATTNTFRDNGILYDDSAQTPVEAPPLTLPWITGSPHALYARVRALFGSDATPWSAPFGFDVVPPAT